MTILQSDLLRSKFDEALDYESFIALGEPEGHRPQWDQRYSQLALDAQQASLVAGFTRQLNILCMTGTWCGDCALQGTALQRIAEGNPERIDLRFLLRSDEQADLIVKSTINGGFRVPVTWFFAEDMELVSRFGDRTLSRYRSMARKSLGDRVTIQAPPPVDPVREVLTEMLKEVERVHLLLRLSGRLRQIHGD